VPDGDAGRPRFFTCATAIADPIHDAVGAGKVEQVRRFLAEGADVNANIDDGNAPLHAAAVWGHTGVAELLRKHGARE